MDSKKKSQECQKISERMVSSKINIYFPIGFVASSCNVANLSPDQNIDIGLFCKILDSIVSKNVNVQCQHCFNYFFIQYLPVTTMVWLWLGNSNRTLFASLCGGMHTSISLVNRLGNRLRFSVSR